MSYLSCSKKAKSYKRPPKFPLSYFLYYRMWAYAPHSPSPHPDPETRQRAETDTERHESQRQTLTVSACATWVSDTLRVKTAKFKTSRVGKMLKCKNGGGAGEAAWEAP